MITCKQDLINTYIKNDHGELRDLYLAKCEEFNISVNEEADWYDWDYVMVDVGSGVYFLNTDNDEPAAKQITLSDLKPKSKQFISKALEGSIKEIVNEQFAGCIKRTPVSTECKWDMKGQGQEKPRTKVDYDHLDRSNFNVWDLKPLFDSGELYSKTSEGEYDQYCKSSPTYMLRHFMEYGVYRKVERSVEWFDDAVEYIRSLNGEANAIDFTDAESDGKQMAINISAVLDERQAKDFARILLEQEGD